MKRVLLAISMSGAMLLAACETAPTEGDVAPKHTPIGKEIAPPPAPTPGLTVRQRNKLALDLLGQGDANQAKAEVDATLLEDPNNELARNLLAQITEDPKILLGSESFAYTIQPGETLSILADRFLDDRFKFYVLARYNGIANPGASEVGRMIMIPGQPRKGRVVRAPAPQAGAPEAAAPTRVVPAKPAAPRAPVRNPARASELRGRALELMNSGLIARAVTLLQQALSFDPGNTLIQRDLDRARRILNGVRP